MGKMSLAAVACLAVAVITGCRSHQSPAVEEESSMTESDSVELLKEADGEVHVLPVLLQPDEVEVLYADEIEERTPMKLSPMPTGLLVTLTEEEILDLLSFLQKPK